jgi:predicted acylesterase/phospholipase RssA
MIVQDSTPLHVSNLQMCNEDTDISMSSMDLSKNFISEMELLDPPLLDPPFIEHLVIPGGGISGLICYGALKESHERGFWDISNIKSIYGTSAGAVIAVILALKYDWQTIDNYLIRRPWHNICNFNMYSIIGSFEKRGIFDIQLIEGILQPLFGGMDIPLTITLLEFYERTQIELHFYATQFKSFEVVDFSYKTHPEWTVVKAVYASAALPIFLSPLEKDDDYYIDGGVFLNYPLGPCLKNGVDPKTILGIHKVIIVQDEFKSDSTLFDYIIRLLNKIFFWILTKTSVDTIDHQIRIQNTPVSIYDLYKMSSDESVRTEWIQQGIQAGREFCSKYGLGSSHLMAKRDDK